MRSTSSSSLTLATIASAQLAAGVAGHVVAVRRRLPYDLAFPPISGRPENVARDSLVLGTALSAPVAMLGLQAVATSRLFRGADRRATRAVAGLGSMMISGYLGERVVRRRLGGDWDPVESTIAASGLVLAAAMAVGGARALLRS
ncbi:MAG TPA: hypothetical protein VLR26_00705 [Frankiaceae bacterium]|nr:hypothetical protein [Frankiaceae bacterium]